MSYLGIDIGTSGCKAVLFAETGTPLGDAYRPYAVRSVHPGWAELDSQEVIDACRAVIGEAAPSAGSDPVRALAISSQGEAFTPVGAKGEYLSHALVSSDSRAADLIPPFVDTFGLDRLYRITGHTPAPLFSLFKLLWIKTHRPALWRQRPRFLCFEDLLHLALGVNPAMGWPLAGRTLLFDVATHRWSGEILEALELDEGQLARPVPSGEIVGVVPAGVAADFGLPPGVKVVAGGHDQTLAALGAGVTEAGTAMYAAGTVECLCPAVPRLIRTDALRRNNLCSYDYSLPGWYTSIAYSLTGSNLLHYFREQFASGRAYDDLLSEMPKEPSGLMALPYFTPSGTPHFDSRTAGALYGWRLTTQRGEVLKAMMEAVALEMKLNLNLLEASGIPVRRLIATGGGSRNRSLVQLKSDVLDRPIEVMRVVEAGCLGAASLAQSAATKTSAFKLATRNRVSEATVHPDPERAEHYTRTYERYVRFYSGMKELAAQLKTMD